MVATTTTFGTLDIGVIGSHSFATSPDIPDWARGIQFPSVRFRAAKPEVLRLGDEFFSEPLQAEMYKESPFTFEVSFDRPDILAPEPATKTLQNFTNLVDGIVEAFLPLLP